MPRTHIQAIVLAAGRSVRFKSETSKLLFTLCGQEMIVYPLATLQQLSIPITVVLGYNKEALRKTIEAYGFEAVNCVEQAHQLGTGDAVASTISSWYAEHILVMNGDMPLIEKEFIEELIDAHIMQQATVSFVISHNTDPSSSAGYGRIVYHDKEMKIVEARDFNGDAHTDCFVNAGIYIFKTQFIRKYIHTLQTHENSRELYLTDLIEIASKHGFPITTVKAPFDTVRGINTLKELWVAEQIKRAEIIEHWMLQGVRFICAQSVHIDMNVTIGTGSSIHAGVQILKGARIGKQCHIGPYTTIQNSMIADHVQIHGYSVISDTTIEEYVQVGPFAHTHSNNIIQGYSIIGNFVEIKKSSIEQGTKIKHLAYIGDATIGARVNIGAGTVVCNYDGITKHPTTIENDVFIGSNNSLIAPRTIKQHAMTAAGSVITHDVPEYSLAVARAPQVNKENYTRHYSSGNVGNRAKLTETKQME